MAAFLEERVARGAALEKERLALVGIARRGGDDTAEARNFLARLRARRWGGEEFFCEVGDGVVLVLAEHCRGGGCEGGARHGVGFDEAEKSHAPRGAAREQGLRGGLHFGGQRGVGAGDGFADGVVVVEEEGIERGVAEFGGLCGSREAQQRGDGLRQFHIAEKAHAEQALVGFRGVVGDGLQRGGDGLRLAQAHAEMRRGEAVLREGFRQLLGQRWECAAFEGFLESAHQ